MPINELVQHDRLHTDESTQAPEPVSYGVTDAAITSARGGAVGADALREMRDHNDVAGMQKWLAEHPPYEIADEIRRSDDITAILLFRLLDKDHAVEVFEELDPDNQQNVLSGLRDPAFFELVEAMDPDDRARLLGEAPAKFAQRVLAGLSPHERALTADLLGYPEGSVGRIMSPEFVLLRRDLTAERALAQVRARGGNAETVYTLPVTDAQRRFSGVVALRDLVLGSPTDTVANLADTDVPMVQATDDAEAAARLMQEANLLALTVVDSENRVVGLLTIDDAVEMIEAADSEDIARQSAAEPLTIHYMAASVLKVARSRVIWLLLLVAAAAMTVSVLAAFEQTLDSIPKVAFFVPMLIGTGGNVGAQAATAAVRALALGEVRFTDVLKVAWRECRVGFALGVMLSVLAGGIAIVFADAQLAVAVVIALVVVCTWAAVVGSTMPLLARRVGIDPAVISAPLVTTLVDATGLLIYFLVAISIVGV
ncbi:MAG TPA: magnesium transporter [Jiangellaceae bacterium]|nr:magnesium transporter [Jiangellaceae bacterium]